MKKNFTAPHIAIGLLVLVVVVFAFRQWKEPIRPDASSIALLLPDSLPVNSPFVQMWQSSALEEGIRLQPLHISEWVRSTSLGAYRWEGIILPDTFHREMHADVASMVHSYVANGGNLMLVYDGGLLTGDGLYHPEKSPFSDLAGVDYGMYSELGEGVAGRSRFGLAQSSTMEQLHIPPGRYASKNLTFSDATGDSLAKNNDFAAQIYDYSAAPQTFATLTTRGTPRQVLMRDEKGGMLASRHRFGNGETLFVNFPLTYLKQRTDGVFLHSFLRYFASDMLQQPRFASTPDGKGGIVLNWHVDAKPALPAMRQLMELGIFKEGPFSFHFTAGPDRDVHGDGNGLNVPGNPEVRSMVQSLAAQGHAIGNHGGWIHNYFGQQVDDNNAAQFEEFLVLNRQAMAQVTAKDSREYSSPMGNQPPWVTRWLEWHGVTSYYLAGNVGMGPTRAWMNAERMSTMWAFPVMTLGPVATAEDAFFQRVPSSTYAQWLLEVARFVERDQVLRLVYFHPPGAVLYANAVSGFVAAIKSCREARTCQWMTMTQATEFLNRREQVSWQLVDKADGLQLVAKDERDLDRMAWYAPKARFARPVVLEGKAEIDGFGSEWRITALPGKQLKVGLKSLRITLENSGT